VLYSRMLEEMLADMFSAAAFFQRVWGTNPAEENETASPTVAQRLDSHPGKVYL